jgi:predicted metalloendopeptidase
MARKLVFLLSFLLFSCNGETTNKRIIDVSGLSTALGVELRYFDGTVRPQDDFYQYVNGRWLNLMELPDDRSSFGAFAEVTDDVNRKILNYMKTIMATPDGTLSADQLKIKNLTLSFSNLEQVDAIGLSPLALDFEKVNNLKSDQIVEPM